MKQPKKKCEKCGKCCKKFEAFLDLKKEENKLIINAILAHFKKSPSRLSFKNIRKIGFVVDADCVFLDDNLCRIYSERPFMCKNYKCKKLIG